MCSLFPLTAEYCSRICFGIHLLVDNGVLAVQGRPFKQLIFELDVKEETKSDTKIT